MVTINENRSQRKKGGKTAVMWEPLDAKEHEGKNHEPMVGTVLSSSYAMDENHWKSPLGLSLYDFFFFYKHLISPRAAPWIRQSVVCIQAKTRKRSCGWKGFISTCRTKAPAPCQRASNLLRCLCPRDTKIPSSQPLTFSLHPEEKQRNLLLEIIKGIRLI